ncbi:hypothetical protein OIU34_23660 [Pararhizobium sp. BT-229]|uniref:hypothetical protein n=1 Tax=Pararhizobium sp. BT-229 TaxID=2986923 RepID=UPI0021F75643|nr:hypothetical protein [Pararhizobium sp. BT-229]MCV9964894.1 hypothetical protein [Pararhizobium sp. BT-229]
MKIEKYRIYGSREPASRKLFDEHLDGVPGVSRREFRTEEVIPAVTYAAHYFVDAVQDLLYETMREGKSKPVDIELASGWRVRTLDLGLHWKRHIELVNTLDPEVGFILEGELDCNRKQAENLTGMDLVRSIFADLDAAQLAVKNNQVTDLFDPANSKRFTEIGVYPYHTDEGGYHKRARIVKRLRTNDYVREAFEHRPHRMIDPRSVPPELRSEYSMVGIETTGRPVTPGAVMRVLPILSEFLSAVDKKGLEAAYEAQIDRVHYTLHHDLWHILAATRSCLNTASADASYPPPQFVAMVEELWSRTVCVDVLQFLSQINEATAELINLGHNSAEETFDCNDGRTRVYATTDGDGCKVFVDRDDFGVCVSVRNDRIVVSTGNYEAGTEERVLFDFTAEDDVVTGVNEIVPYDDLAAGILRRALVDLSSVHCHIVSDPKLRAAASPKKR